MTRAIEWAARVEAWRESGLSAHEFCRGREYKGRDLLWWSSHFNRHGKPKGVATKAVRLARVIRSDAGVRRSPPIIVELGGARVEVSAGVDQVALEMVLRALSGAEYTR
jgi:hypothetical protein